MFYRENFKFHFPRNYLLSPPSRQKKVNKKLRSRRVWIIEMESEDIMCETSYQLVNRVHAGMRPKLTNLLDFVKPNLSLESNEILEVL